MIAWPSCADLAALLPELLCLAGAAVIFLVQVLAPRRRAAAAAALFLAAAMAAVFAAWGHNALAFGGLIAKGQDTLFFQGLLLAAALLAVVLGDRYLGAGERGGEFFSLLLFSVFGLMLIAATRDLMVLFLGMEISALALYVLVGYLRTVPEGLEASMKYYLLGSFASALFLLGVAFLYGVTGETLLPGLSAASTRPALLFAGWGLIVAGLAFKVAAAPFHGWAPDVYEGSPLPVAAFISVAPKVAAFAVLVRLCTAAAECYAITLLPDILLMLSLASMIVGNLAALKQKSLVRMLAYSGIGQIGYLLLGLLALPADGAEAIAFYLAVYAAANLGAFAVIVAWSQVQGRGLTVDDLAGGGDANPVAALCLTIFLVSLTGIPPLGGFMAKLSIFKAAIAAGYVEAVLVAVVMTVVSLFYYLRPVVALYMEAGESRLPSVPARSFLGGVCLTLAALVLLAGVFPGPLLDLLSTRY